MNKLQLPQAKLLYAVSQIYRKRRIDQTQKRILKEKIISDNVEIHELLEQNENETDLFDKLVALVRISEEPNETRPQNKEVLASVQLEEGTSPYGEFLRRKKGNNQNKHKYEANAIKVLLNPQKAQ